MMIFDEMIFFCSNECSLQSMMIVVALFVACEVMYILVYVAGFVWNFVMFLGCEKGRLGDGWVALFVGSVCLIDHFLF